MKRLNSSVEALRHVIKRKAFESLVYRCHDRRELFQMAAKHLNKDEEALMCDVAEYMDIPVLKRLNHQFFQVETAHLPTDEQRRNAFALLSSHSGAKATACLEPIWLHPYPTHYFHGPLLLCGWDLLRKLYSQCCIKPGLQENTSKITDEVSIENILMRLSFLGVNEGIIEFSDYDVRYKIVAPDLHTYSGLLYLSAASDIEQRLSQTAKNTFPQIQRVISGMQISITVHEYKSRRIYRLIWTPLPETLWIQKRFNEYLQ